MIRMIEYLFLFLSFISFYHLHHAVCLSASNACTKLLSTQIKFLSTKNIGSLGPILLFSARKKPNPSAGGLPFVLVRVCGNISSGGLQ